MLHDKHHINKRPHGDLTFGSRASPSAHFPSAGGISRTLPAAARGFGDPEMPTSPDKTSGLASGENDACEPGQRVSYAGTAGLPHFTLTANLGGRGLLT